MPTNGIVFSEGQNIQTYRSNITNSSSYDIGFANQVPTSGTKSNAAKISDTRTTGARSSAVQKPFTQIDAGT